MLHLYSANFKNGEKSPCSKALNNIKTACYHHRDSQYKDETVFNDETGIPLLARIQLYIESTPQDRIISG